MASAPVNCATTAGDDCFMLVLDTVVYGGLVLLMEAYGERLSLRQVTAPDPGTLPEPLPEDASARAERERVEGLDPAAQVLYCRKSFI